MILNIGTAVRLRNDVTAYHRQLLSSQEEENHLGLRKLAANTLCVVERIIITDFGTRALVASGDWLVWCWLDALEAKP